MITSLSHLLNTTVCVCVCVCVCCHPIFSRRQDCGLPPGSHRRKVTQHFSSTFLLRCLPYFFSREGLSPFLSLVDRGRRILCTNELIVLHLFGFFFFFCTSALLSCGMRVIRDCRVETVRRNSSPTLSTRQSSTYQHQYCGNT